MDLRMAFTAFLFAFCAVVLADRIHGVCEQLATALGLKRPVAALPLDGVAAKAANSWYVFFSPKTLTGGIGVAPRPTVTVRPVARRAFRDTRPRLRA
jgi:hypothetical protein